MSSLCCQINIFTFFEFKLTQALWFLLRNVYSPGWISWCPHRSPEHITNTSLWFEPNLPPSPNSMDHAHHDKRSDNNVLTPITVIDSGWVTLSGTLGPTRLGPWPDPRDQTPTVPQTLTETYYSKLTYLTNPCSCGNMKYSSHDTRKPWQQELVYGGSKGPRLTSPTHCQWRWLGWVRYYRCVYRGVCDPWS